MDYVQAYFVLTHALVCVASSTALQVPFRKSVTLSHTQVGNLKSMARDAKKSPRGSPAPPPADPRAAVREVILTAERAGVGETQAAGLAAEVCSRQAGQLVFCAFWHVAGRQCAAQRSAFCMGAGACVLQTDPLLCCGRASRTRCLLCTRQRCWQLLQPGAPWAPVPLAPPRPALLRCLRSPPHQPNTCCGLHVLE